MYEYMLEIRWPASLCVVTIRRVDGWGQQQSGSGWSGADALADAEQDCPPNGGGSWAPSWCHED